jgi:hypothetical protein
VNKAATVGNSFAYADTSGRIHGSRRTSIESRTIAAAVSEEGDTETIYYTAKKGSEPC